MKLILIFILFFSSITVNAQNSKCKILPKDECKEDVTLVLFLEKLKASVRYKDTSVLFKLFDKNIVSSYGGGVYGVNGFEENWNLKDTVKTELWDCLSNILRYGGVFDVEDNKRVFIIPYYSANKLFPKLERKEISPFNIMVCINQDVAIYNSPKLDSKIRGHIDYEILITDDSINDNYTKINTKPEWVYVGTVDKRLFGWIQIKNVEFYTGHRLVIDCSNKSYKIKSFAPFD